MNEQIAKKFAVLRDAWEPTEDCYVAGSIPEGRGGLDPNVFPFAAELCAVSDGAACGTVVFHKVDEIANYQFICDVFEGGSDSWLCIASFGSQPLLVRRKDGMTAWGNRDDLSVTEIAPFEEFLDEWLLGDRYLELRGKTDEWFEFTKRAGVR